MDNDPAPWPHLGDRMENLEQTIVHCERALTVYTPRSFGERMGNDSDELDRRSDEQGLSSPNPALFFGSYKKPQQRCRDSSTLFRPPFGCSG
jgi:hypothetical protein